MKGYEVFKRVLNLLGYINTDDAIGNDNSLYQRSFYLINQILSDLKQKEIENMNDEINIPEKSLEALFYGVAMLLALSNGDGSKNSLFAGIYNSKRSAALSESEKIADNMPKVTWGEI